MTGRRGGRKPKPTALKLLEGKPGHRPLPRGEPHPPVEAPPCPEHLDALAREEWERIAPRLVAIRVLSALDRSTLAAYCSSWSRWVRTERKIARLRSDTVTSDSGATKLHPLFGLRDQVQRQMQSAAVELGLTPSSRARVRAAPKEDPTDPAERFFGPRPVRPASA